MTLPVQHVENQLKYRLNQMVCAPFIAVTVYLENAEIMMLTEITAVFYGNTETKRLK